MATYKTIKHKLIEQGYTEADAKRMNDAFDLVNKYQQDLQIDNEAIHLATKADVTKIEGDVRVIDSKLNILMWMIGGLAIWIPVVIGILGFIFKKP